MTYLATVTITLVVWVVVKRLVVGFFRMSEPDQGFVLMIGLVFLMCASLPVAATIDGIQTRDAVRELGEVEVVRTGQLCFKLGSTVAGPFAVHVRDSAGRVVPIELHDLTIDDAPKAGDRIRLTTRDVACRAIVLEKPE